MTDKEMNADIMDKLCGLVADYDDKLPIDRNTNYLVLTLAAGAISRLIGENERLRKANSEMGWELNPDRMGGQFTEEELNRGSEWR